MPRIISVPAQTLRLEIRALQEVPASPREPGYVRVDVGRVDDAGAFIIPQQFETYEIRGKMFEALVGPAAEWAPDKPDGTYRNDDLWYFMDRIKAAAEEAAEVQRKLDQV
ncbi:hypothetical protein RAMLITH_01655 [Ramlibacter sp. RBP-2]|uniref:Uncharacterized protein n=1 Tax=Ramlibacter lithotrophicus TaxID=2606681 RepID=A0A7X6DC83_9BURK|nr:hypothetical protein [Ramlibacter lithotrophicus]NKE64512.1 hypothetical protein [Ramlibacter lithotrophicus]